MRLFNASSLFNEDAVKEIRRIANDPEKLKNKVIDIKEALLQTYHFEAYNVPEISLPLLIL